MLQVPLCALWVQVLLVRLKKERLSFHPHVAIRQAVDLEAARRKQVILNTILAQLQIKDIMSLAAAFFVNLQETLLTMATFRLFKPNQMQHCTGAPIRQVQIGVLYFQMAITLAVALSAALAELVEVVVTAAAGIVLALPLALHTTNLIKNSLHTDTLNRPVLRLGSVTGRILQTNS